MVQLSIGELAEIVGGTLQFDSMPPLGGDLEPLRRVQVDSGRVAPGDVFWGLVQDGQNGAWRAEEAYSRGALGAVVCSRRLTPWAGRFSLEVEDTEWALWRLARWTRRKYQGKVVAVLGGASQLTAEMIAAALGDRKCISTSCREPSQQIATLLGLLELDCRHEAAIFDFGGRQQDDVRKLARLCRPDVVVILDAGCDSQSTSAGLPHSYAEFLAELPRSGWAVVDGDNCTLRRFVRNQRGQKMLVGRGVHCDVVATDVQFRQNQLSFRVDGAPYSANVCGRHYLASALAACTVAQIAGASPREIAGGLSQFQPPTSQCAVHGARQITVIDETSASLSRVLPSLEACGEFATTGRRVVVYGLLGEASDNESRQLRRQVGRAVVDRCGADLLIVCGPRGEEVAEAAREAGMLAGRTLVFSSAQDAAPRIDSLLATGDVVLVTGSAEADMRQVVESLTAEKPAIAA